MTGWAWLWIAWGLTGLTAEVIALIRPARSDTLSESIWILLRSHPLVWFISAGLASWAAFHLFGPTWALPY